MRILPNGVAVIEGDTHHAEWCAEQGLVHDRWFADIICRHIKPGDVVVDGGANIGTLTRAMLDAGAIVLAFEPNPKAEECLRRNCPEASVFKQGLWDSMSRSRGLGCGFIHLPNAGASFCVSKNQLREYSNSGHASMTFLDRFKNQEIRLIKLDIEGYEAKALRGAAETIVRCRPVLIIEVNRAALERSGDSEDELLSLIESLGYQWSIIQPQCKRGDEQYDIEALPI